MKYSLALLDNFTDQETWSGLLGLAFYLTCMAANQAGWAPWSSKESGTDCMRNDNEMSSKLVSSHPDGTKNGVELIGGETVR